LQVMDHGALTDHNGRKADFRNTVMIMTSNVGSREMERRSLGIMEENQTQAQAQKAVEQVFSPEFRNRLDSTVFFNPLERETLLQVVQKHLIELESQLLAKRVEVEFDQSVLQWLAEKGYDRRMGARPLGRVIQDSMKRPLSEEILFGKLENGGAVRIKVAENESPSRLEFIFSEDLDSSFESRSKDGKSDRDPQRVWSS
jgi:ATP-dependent Clp protease ATP-binding subunit ClpA